MLTVQSALRRPWTVAATLHRSIFGPDGATPAGIAHLSASAGLGDRQVAHDERAGRVLGTRRSVLLPPVCMTRLARVIHARCPGGLGLIEAPEWCSPRIDWSRIDQSPRAR